MSDDLRKLQLEELNMVRSFTEICEKYGFRYFIIGGTLLGAVRHKGFIPWDDDVDIAMPRADYNKLLGIMKEHDTSDFYFINYDTDVDYPYAWARMNSRNMKVINHMANIPRTEQVFIDIIPLDGFPDGKLRRGIHKIKLSFWWTLNQLCQFDRMVDQKRKRSAIAKICIELAGRFKWIGHFISYKTCLKNLNKTLSKYPYDIESKEIINYLAAYGFKEVFPRSAFESATWYEFEDTRLKGPNDSDSICKIIYGNYMELPPEEDRNKHHIEIIKNED